MAWCVRMGAAQERAIVPLLGVILVGCMELLSTFRASYGVWTARKPHLRVGTGPVRAVRCGVHAPAAKKAYST